MSAWYAADDEQLRIRERMFNFCTVLVNMEYKINLCAVIFCGRFSIKYII